MQYLQQIKPFLHFENVFPYKTRSPSTRHQTAVIQCACPLCVCPLCTFQAGPNRQQVLYSAEGTCTLRHYPSLWTGGRSFVGRSGG